MHYQDFLRDSQDSQLFGADDRMQIEADYKKTSQHYENLLRTCEQGKAFYYELISSMASLCGSFRSMLSLTSFFTENLHSVRVLLCNRLWVSLRTLR